MANKVTILPSNMVDANRMDSLYHRAGKHIDQARRHIRHTIDIDMVKAYWLIGQEIVEEEQFGMNVRGMAKLF